MSSESPDRFTVFVRSLEPSTAAPVHATVVESLTRLAEADGVPFDLRVWGDALPLSSPFAQTPTARELHETIRELQAWAEAREATLPGFERVQTDTLVGPSREAMTLPELLLAGYREGELVDVAPRVEGDHRYDVSAPLARLADALESVAVPPREARS